MIANEGRLPKRGRQSARVTRAVELYRRMDRVLASPPSPLRTLKVRALTRRINSNLDVLTPGEAAAYYQALMRFRAEKAAADASAD